MAKNMARIINGIVTNIERHSDMQNDTDNLISINDLLVTFGDTFDGKYFYHDGKKILTITEEMSNIIKEQEMQNMLLLESDMKILDIELALMEHMPITLNLGENSMLRSATYFNFIKNHIVNETYSKDYLENVMNKYLATNRLTQEEYDELYKMLYPPVYDIALPIE